MTAPKGKGLKEQVLHARLRRYNDRLSDRVSASLGYRVRVGVYPVGYVSRRKGSRLKERMRGPVTPGEDIV